jgi:hypothetical protein
MKEMTEVLAMLSSKSAVETERRCLPTLELY